MARMAHDDLNVIRSLQLSAAPGFTAVVADHHLYRAEPAYRFDFDPRSSNGSIAGMSNAGANQACLRHWTGLPVKVSPSCVISTPVPRLQYRVGVPQGGWLLEELLDA